MHYEYQFKVSMVKRYSNGESVESICLSTNIAKSTFYSWLKEYKTTTTKSGFEINHNEYFKLKQKNEKLALMVEVLQKVHCTASSPLQEKLHELELLYGQYSVNVLCEALNVARGTFYNHILRNKKGNNSYQARRELLSEKIRTIYDDSKQVYGPKKIRAILAEQGERTSDRMVTELMTEMNLYSIRSSAKKEYKKNEKKKKKDYLKLNFKANKPNMVWASDITCFRFKNRSYNICVIIDLFSRKAISYKISLKNSTQLVTATIKMAVKNRNPDAGLILHSDRGSTYTAYAVENLLRTLDISHSFSPTGSPYHNAVIESFFSNLKREELYRTNYHSEKEFKESVAKYIDEYNNKRPHSTLANKTPNAYENSFFKKHPSE